MDVGVFTANSSGTPGNSTKDYGASVTGYLGWIRSNTGIPAIPANTIVRDSASGRSWYKGTDGFMQWIPNGGTYQCLQARGAAVYNTNLFTALSVPIDATANASCGAHIVAAGIPTQSGSQRMDDYENLAFGLSNDGNAAWTPMQVVAHVISPSGRVSEEPCAGGTGLTVAPGASWTCRAATYLDALGTYSATVRWQNPDGTWSDGSSGAFPVTLGSLTRSLARDPLQQPPRR